MKIGTGQAECVACGYSYDPKKGDSEYPVSPGTKFEVSKPGSSESQTLRLFLACYLEGMPVVQP